MSDVLRQAFEASLAFRRALPDRPVGARASLGELRAALDRPLPETGADPGTVLADLARNAEPGLIGEPGPRFFGYVIGGSSEAALGADWLTSAWDQNAGLYSAAPAAMVVEEVAVRWILDLLDLPRESGVGFVTGCQMAHFTCLAAARDEMLRRAGWDAVGQGLQGAPELRVIAGDEVHVTVPRALRFLGLGDRRLVKVAVDSQGRMKADALEEALEAAPGPKIVCAQAGNVNTGAFDPLEPIADLCERHGAWLHLDGAFGLWARAVPDLKELARGADRAQSWATDAHKWLNVPYDSGIAIVRDAAAHVRAMTARAAYLIQSEGAARDAVDWVPEFSRRARGFPLYAQLRVLGRRGVAELVGGSCALARRAAEGFARIPGTAVLNDVVLNQVLVAFTPPAGMDPAAHLNALVARIQAEGTCWASGSVWQGRPVLRFSVSGQDTREADIDRSVAAIAKVAQA
ncbi:MAG: aminotransferase class V-fold PLP-dependent enzyme [Holophagaceae bacterium]